MQQRVRFEEVLELVRQLSPEEKRRLIRALGPEIQLDALGKHRASSRSLLGVVEELGPAPSEEEIDEARQEAWKNFPREDI